MPLQDVGNGLKVSTGPDYEAGLDSVLKQSQLLQLMQKSKGLDLSAEKDALDIKLKKNELDRLDITNAIQDQAKEAAKNKEQREQAQFVFNSLKEVLVMADRDFDVAKFSLESAFPGATLSQNENGLVTMAIKTPQGIKSVPFIPEKASLTPEQKISIENQYRDEWIKAATPYAVAAQQFGSMEQAAKLNSAAGDLSITYSVAKVNDPTTGVMPGERMTVENAPNVPQQIRNLYNRNLDPKGPFLSPQDRQDFINATRIKVNQYKETALSTGRSYYDMSKRRLNPANVLVNVGDIGLSSFEPKAGSGQQPPPVAPSVAPNAAGSRNTQAAPAAAPQSTPAAPAVATPAAKNTQIDRFNQLQQNMFKP